MAEERTPFAAYYKQFRAGKAFFVLLAAFITIWVIVHSLTGFDAAWGLLNLILSIEASLAMSLFMMLSEKQDRMQQQQDDLQKKQLVYMQHLLEVTVELLEHQKTADQRSLDQLTKS